MRPASRLAILAIFAAATLAAHADTFTYDFEGTDISASFTYTSPFLLPGDASFVPTTCSVLGVGCTLVIFDVSDSQFTIDVVGNKQGFDAVTFPDLPSTYFDVGVNVGPDGILTITDIPSPPPATTPEPSTFALLGTGILGLAGVARRKFSR